jgi:hypothetical protein
MHDGPKWDRRVSSFLDRALLRAAWSADAIVGLACHRVDAVDKTVICTARAALPHVRLTARRSVLRVSQYPAVTAGKRAPVVPIGDARNRERNGCASRPFTRTDLARLDERAPTGQYDRARTMFEADETRNQDAGVSRDHACRAHGERP